MNLINGISFEDWASANGQLSLGMSQENVLKILGIELPVLEDTNEKWTAFMTEQHQKDMMAIIADPTTDSSSMINNKYTAIFNNPTQGKFGNVTSQSQEETTANKVPNFETYKKISAHLSVVKAIGIDGVTTLEKDHNLSMGEWSQAANYWGNFYREIVFGNNDAKKVEIMELGDTYENKWTTFYNEKYKGQGADISNDIDY